MMNIYDFIGTPRKEDEPSPEVTTELLQEQAELMRWCIYHRFVNRCEFKIADKIAKIEVTTATAEREFDSIEEVEEVTDERKNKSKLIVRVFQEGKDIEQQAFLYLWEYFNDGKALNDLITVQSIRRGRTRTIHTTEEITVKKAILRKLDKYTAEYFRFFRDNIVDKVITEDGEEQDLDPFNAVSFRKWTAGRDGTNRTRTATHNGLIIWLDRCHPEWREQTQKYIDGKIGWSEYRSLYYSVNREMKNRGLVNKRPKKKKREDEKERVLFIGTVEEYEKRKKENG